MCNARSAGAKSLLDEGSKFFAVTYTDMGKYLSLWIYEIFMEAKQKIFQVFIFFTDNSMMFKNILNKI